MSENININNQSVESLSVSNENSAKKKLSGKAKIILIISLAVIVALAGFIGLRKNDVEEAVEAHISETYGDTAKDIKKEYSKKYKVDVGYGIDMDAEAYIYSAKGYDCYYICLVVQAEDFIDVESEVCYSEAELKLGIKQGKETLKELIKDIKNGDY